MDLSSDLSSKHCFPLGTSGGVAISWSPSGVGPKEIVGSLCCFRNLRLGFWMGFAFLALGVAGLAVVSEGDVISLSDSPCQVSWLLCDGRGGVGLARNLGLRCPFRVAGFVA